MVDTHRRLTVDKKMDKVLESIRLEAIERDLRSSAARLDNRQIYPVEEVINPRMATKDAARAKKMKERRQNNVAVDIRVQGALAVARMEAKGVKIEEAVDDFDNEEKIWKNKSRNPSYYVKRKFDDPELHAFAKLLNKDSKKVGNFECVVS
jgi:hypothetical protein